LEADASDVDVVAYVHCLTAGRALRFLVRKWLGIAQVEEGGSAIAVGPTNPLPCDWQAAEVSPMTA
jgi:hypothetical protein